MILLNDMVILSIVENNIYIIIWKIVLFEGLVIVNK